jgi:hypothetical protein
MKFATVVTPLTLAVVAACGMGSVAFAKPCDQGPVERPLLCVDLHRTNYFAQAFADANSVTVVLTTGDGSPVRADTAGYDEDGTTVAGVVNVVPGSVESDTKDPGDKPIVTHDLLLLVRD